MRHLPPRGNPGLEPGTATTPEAALIETFSSYCLGQEQHPAVPTDLGMYQLEEPNFTPAWSSVTIIKGTAQEGGEYTSLSVFCGKKRDS